MWHKPDQILHTPNYNYAIIITIIMILIIISIIQFTHMIFLNSVASKIAHMYIKKQIR